VTARVVFAPADEWEVVTGHHYVMRPEDFADGCYTVTDAASGRILVIGEHKLGYRIRTYLNEPLCEGCDDPVADGVCHGCLMIHADLVPDEEVRGDPFLKARTA
jgi:hypothetical protein